MYKLSDVYTVNVTLYYVAELLCNHHYFCNIKLRSCYSSKLRFCLFLENYLSHIRALNI